MSSSQERSFFNRNYMIRRLYFPTLFLPGSRYLYLVLFLFIKSAILFAQYPDVIEMHKKMIGDATITARREIIHNPGFEANTGLNYHAYIDYNFNGSGIPYQPPIPPAPISPQPSDRNFIITYTPQMENYDPEVTNYTCAQLSVDIMYYDGLGREEQHIEVMGTPDQYDFIMPIRYDDFGRRHREYVSYENSTQQNGLFDAYSEINQKNFYGQIFGIGNKEYGFSEKGYENSPVSRVIKQSYPGKVWALNQASQNDQRFSEFEYKTNQSSINSWKKSGDQFTAITYEQSTLYLSITKNENRDPNRGVSNVYKNKSGQIMLKESESDGISYKTYYIYDDFDLLRCVMSPKANSPEGVDNLELCYYYNYDTRQRMVEKKLPGAGWVYIVYDNRDRMVMTQDAKMREEDPEHWLLICYDQLNRPVMTGIYSHPTPLSRMDMQDLFDGQSEVINEYRNGNSQAADHGYTRYLVEWLGGGTTGYEVLTVNYYDRYDFAPAGYGFDASNGVAVLLSEVLNPPLNMLVGTKTKILTSYNGLNEWILDVTYFDNKYRVIQMVSDGPIIDGKDIVTSKFSFSGQILEQETKHLANNQSIDYIEKFVYDHRNRLVEHRVKGIPGESEVILSSLKYDQIGQLKQKRVHSNSLDGEPFTQGIDYSYNTRGWLKSINDPNGVMNDEDIFGMRLLYDEINQNFTTVPQYNGNISSLEWKTKRANDHVAFAFAYDKLDRLTTGFFFSNDAGGWNHNDSFDETGISYDENGNILTLVRYSDNGNKVDDLSYNYLYGGHKGNQLNYVSDASGDQPGLDYPGQVTSTQGFYYDPNGNMTRHHDKGINTPIVYNFLNKPELIDFGNEEKIQYVYDAVGNKVAKVVIDGSALPASSLIYSGNFIYNLNGELQYLLIGDGRLVPEGQGFRFEYFMKDHLGSTRATFAPAAPGVAQVAEYQHYYPFGMQIDDLCYSTGFDLPNHNLYNGKELQPDYGLEWYDYGARFYDAVLGRWHSPDPKAEKYISVTPYAYCTNNPVLFIDPNGEDLYLYYYTTGNKDHSGNADKEADRAFMMAAITRALDLMKSDEFGEGDAIVLKGISDLGGLEKAVEGDVAANSEKYGQTKEFGLWSHGGLQGPTGADRTSQGAPSGSPFQLSTASFGKIDFNWVDKGAKAGFYGCRTGKDPDNQKNSRPGVPFVQTLSGSANMKNVDVWGQTQRAYPSPYTDARYASSSITSGNHQYPTYFVGSITNPIVGFNSRLGPTYAFPMSVYRNGQFVGYKYQPGATLLNK